MQNKILTNKSLRNFEMNQFKIDDDFTVGGALKLVWLFVNNLLPQVAHEGVLCDLLDRNVDLWSQPSYVLNLS